MDENTLKTEIQKLIDKLERVKSQGKYKSYNEENTKKETEDKPLKESIRKKFGIIKESTKILME